MTVAARLRAGLDDAITVVDFDPARGLPAEPGAVVVIGAEAASALTFRSTRMLDAASVVIGEPRVIDHLAASGLRVPCIADDVPELESQVLAALDSHDRNADPVVLDGRLSTGTNGRRCSHGTGTHWTMNDSRAFVDRVVPRVQEGWAEYVAAHRERFVRTFTYLPPAEPGSRALDVSSFPVSCAALAELGYWVAGTHHAVEGGPSVIDAREVWSQFGVSAEITFDGELHSLPCDDEMFDLIVAAEIIEHLPADPSQLLSELNRVLRRGGHLLLTTPNVVSQRALSLAFAGDQPNNYYFYDRDGSLDRHHIEYSPRLLADLARSAGFHIEVLDTFDVWFPPDEHVMATLAAAGHDTHGRGDNIFLLATKVSNFVDRTPPALYTGAKSSRLLSRNNRPRLTRTREMGTS